jgi:hypothetical protein
MRKTSTGIRRDKNMSLRNLTMCIGDGPIKLLVQRQNILLKTRYYYNTVMRITRDHDYS